MKPIGPSSPKPQTDLEIGGLIDVVTIRGDLRIVSKVRKVLIRARVHRTSEVRRQIFRLVQFDF